MPSSLVLSKTIYTLTTLKFTSPPTLGAWIPIPLSSWMSIKHQRSTMAQSELHIFLPRSVPSSAKANSFSWLPRPHFEATFTSLLLSPPPCQILEQTMLTLSSKYTQNLTASPHRHCMQLSPGTVISPWVTAVPIRAHISSLHPIGQAGARDYSSHPVGKEKCSPCSAWLWPQ